jgi:hypothetical protein
MSDVAVKKQLIRSSSESPLRSTMAASISATRARISSTSSASTVVAPRTARTALLDPLTW